MTGRPLLYCLALFVFTQPSAADEPVNLEPARVTLFKNAVGLVSWQGEIPDRRLQVNLGTHPIPSFGSFHLTYGPGLDPKMLVSSRHPRPENQSIQSLMPLLYESAGRTVTLRVAVGDGSEQVTGKLLGSPVGSDRRAAGPYFMSATSETPYSTDFNKKIALVETPAGTRAIRVDQILQVEFPPGTSAPTVWRGESAPSLRLLLNKAAKGETFGVHYLAKGLAWFPSFKVELENDQTLQLTANAEVVNELMDLEGIALELAVGVPSLQFADIESSLGRTQDLSRLIGSIARGYNDKDQTPSASILSQAPTFHRHQRAPGYVAAGAGQLDDLYLFRIDDFSLELGAAAWLSLKKTSLPYRHLYRWEVDDLLEEGQSRRQEESEQVIWHSISFQNQADWPITTAPALVTRDGRVLAQSQTSYTAPGQESLIRITRALALPAAHAEQELSRQPVEERIWGSRYERIQFQGTLVVRNELGKEVDLEVEKMLTGEIVEIDGEPQIVKLPKDIRDVNLKQRISWKVKLEPESNLEITYRYNVLARR